MPKRHGADAHRLGCGRSYQPPGRSRGNSISIGGHLTDRYCPGRFGCVHVDRSGASFDASFAKAGREATIEPWSGWNRYPAAALPLQQDVTGGPYVSRRAALVHRNSHPHHHHPLVDGLSLIARGRPPRVAKSTMQAGGQQPSRCGRTLQCPPRRIRLTFSRGRHRNHRRHRSRPDRRISEDRRQG